MQRQPAPWTGQASGTQSQAGCTGATPDETSRRGRFDALWICLAGIACYANSFHAPFVFDGIAHLRDYRVIRQLWPPWAVLTCSTRPVSMLSFAANYALGGSAVWGYHAVNVAIHVAAALVLYGTIRRTLSNTSLKARYGDYARGIALVTSLVWLVHPLQTQSVTYIYQRQEALMGLFFLLTLYCFARGALGQIQYLKSEIQNLKSKTNPKSKIQTKSVPLAWYTASVLCCLLAIGSKEVAVMAPAVVLWYDRALVSPSWRSLWRRHGAYYAVFAGIFLAALAYIVTRRSWYAGSGVAVFDRISPWEYAMSQPGVIAHYLRLAFWPVGQCLDYGWPIARTAGEIVPPLALIGALIASTAWCVFHRPALGFLGGVFFLILAPTSSVVPIVDLAFEHRMYLPLAAVAVAGTIAGHELGCWWVRRRAAVGRLADVGRIGNPSRRQAALPDGLPIRPTGRRTQAEVGGSPLLPGIIAALVIAGLAAASVLRNYIYRSEVSVWRNVVQEAPLNPRGWKELATALLAAEGPSDAAIDCAARAIALDPKYALAYNTFGMLLAQSGRDVPRAIACFREAFRIDPRFAPAHNNLAVALKASAPGEAAEHFRAALAIDPSYADAHNNFGSLLANQGKLTEAIEHFEQAIRLRPGFGAARENLSRAIEMKKSRVATP